MDRGAGTNTCVKRYILLLLASKQQGIITEAIEKANEIVERIDLFTDSDAILNFSPLCQMNLTFCFYFKYYARVSIFKKSRSFDLRKLCNMSVDVYVFMKALTMKKFSYTLWRVRILQH